MPLRVGDVSHLDEHQLVSELQRQLLNPGEVAPRYCTQGANQVVVWELFQFNNKDGSSAVFAKRPTEVFRQVSHYPSPAGCHG